MKKQVTSSWSLFIQLSSAYFTYHVTRSQILHGAQIAFMCLVQISNQTGTFVLYNISILVLYKLGGQCLLRGTQSLYTTHMFSL